MVMKTTNNDVIKRGEKMRLDKNKVFVIMARNKQTQKDLVEKTKMSTGNLRYAILGLSDSKPATVGRIAEALGVDVTEILAD